MIIKIPNIQINRCLVKDHEENIMVTMTRTVRFYEHFSLPYGSFHIICKIKPGSYNLTKVAIVSNDISLLLSPYVLKIYAFPGTRKPTVIAHMGILSSSM